MRSADFSARANRFLIIFAAVVAASFCFGMYLMFSGPAKRQPSLAAEPAANEKEMLQEADGMLAQKQTEQALILYWRALAANPRSSAAQLGIARGELQAGRERVAAQEFERVLRLDPDNAPVHLDLARIFSHERGTWGLAEKKFRDYLVRRPEDSEAQLGLARVLACQGKAQEATVAFERPAVLPRMTRQDRRDYAFALVKSGQLDKAEVVLKQLTAGGSGDFDLRLQLASLYASRRDWNAALPLFASLLTERPDDPRVNLTYGLGLLASRNHRAALAPLAKARAAMPSSGDAGLGYARALKGVRDLKRAAREFKRVLPQYSADAQILREYADLVFEKGDGREAAKYYKNAEQLGLRDTRLLVGLSGALVKIRRPREALPYLQEAYRREPTDRLAYELARVLVAVGRNEPARVLLSRVRPVARN